MRFGRTKEQIFITCPELKRKFKDRFDAIPTGAMGLYTYMQRLEQGIKQIMCGARKFSLDFISRNDIAALTNTASEISGIRYIMDCDKEEAEGILDN